jgi:tight adherence protein C
LPTWISDGIVSVPLVLIVLIVVAVAGFAAAGYVFMVERARQQAVDRALGGSAAAELRRKIRRPVAAPPSSARQQLFKLAPSSWVNDEGTQQRLVQAGFDGPSAHLQYGLLRIAFAVGLPLVALFFLPGNSLFQVLATILGAAIVGAILPVWYLHRAVRLRQERFRRALPDTLDLLVVCVEAGISLDAAILRVAKDLILVHPELAMELMLVNRKTNAGVTREDALRGLWERTGVDEIRGLVASLIQSEKWGSSSARVLRVSSETLRRKRRQAAEKKAATAPLKMVVPLALLIFPALFVVILGPAFLSIMVALRGG